MARTFCPGGVHFDGATQLVNAALAATDGAHGAMSFWFRANSLDPTSPFWLSYPDSNTNKTIVAGGGQIQTTMGNAIGAGNTVDVYQDNSVDWFDNAWHNVLVATDLSAPTKLAAMVIDGVDHTGVIHSHGAGAGQFQINGYPLYVGGDTFADFFTGDIAELWIGDNVNLLVGGVIPPETVAKFYAGSCPVDLGANGEIPTGTSPCVYLARGPTDAATVFLTNRGTGGDFTVDTGSLTTAEGPCACGSPRQSHVMVGLIPATVGL